MNKSITGKFYKVKRTIGVLLIFALVFTPFTFSGMNKSLNAEAADNTVNGLKSQISSQKLKISDNESKRKALDAEIAQAQKQKQSLTNLNSTYNNLLVNIQEGIDDTNDLITMNDQLMAETEQKLADTQAEYDKNYQNFLSMLKFTYEDGNVDYIGLILKSENFVDFLSRMDRISSIMDYNKSILENLKTSKQDLEDTEATLADSKSQNEQYAQELTAKKADLNKSQTTVLASIKNLDQSIQQKQQLQTQINNDNNSIQNDIAALTKQLQNAQASQKVYVGGQLGWPVALSSNRISSPYGYRTSPITGQREFHTGVDIPAPYGSNVYAANDGIVLKVSLGGTTYGEYIVIDHGGGMTTLYAHNSVILKKVGDKVYKGDVISKIGTTGASTGPHCHFEVAINGARQNPMNYLIQPK
ncbi:MAG: peptidoglycan DD-metalloendopeptidase family protein [Oscillospiraceae bacterium]|nr:peptidoglycan DD-metalloendopeptidase family protein [Oscillospiraceae bacterium]